MKKTTLKAALGGVAIMAMPIAAAAQEVGLVIESDKGPIEITTEAPAPDHMEYVRTVRSGWTFRSPETQALEADDFDNPAMIYVDQATEAWNTVEGEAGESCASCHGDPESMAGVRASMPRWNAEAGEVWTMEMYINDCRENRMQAEAWGWDKQPMKNMTALIAAQSRGMPVNVQIDGPARETWEHGREIYYTRYGQLELSCASCHEQNYDNLIRADHLSQGQINGFPTYRLKQANLVSIHNRFRGCIRDTRGEPFAIGSPENIALELYVASRGMGLDIEGPAVRN